MVAAHVAARAGVVGGEGIVVRVIVVHAGWVPERQATLARLLGQLHDPIVLSSRRPERATVWARRAWEVAEDLDEPVAILNDDVTVCPAFQDVCDSVAAAAPGRTISLHTSLPGSARVPGAWLRTYWLTGPGYILPRGVPTQLLDYWATLPPGFGPNEDNVAIAWAWSRQEPFWSTVPALVEHDTSTRSTLGYDDHPMRSPVVTWRDRDPAAIDWSVGADRPPYLENPWAQGPRLENQRSVLLSGKACSICFARVAVAGMQGHEFCGPCLAKFVGPLLNSVRVG